MPLQSQRQVLAAASEMAGSVGSTENSAQCPLGFIAEAFDRITVFQGRVMIAVSSAGLLQALKVDETPDPSDQMAMQPLELEAPFHIAKRGHAARLMISNDDDQPEQKNQALIKLVARAHHRFQLLAAGKNCSPGEIAAQELTDPSELSRTLQLACLAPDIVQAILQGRQPADLTATKLKKLKNLPLCWEEQRQLLGFAA